MKNKKLVLGLLCLAALGVTACNGGGEETSSSNEPATTTATTTTPAHTHNYEFQSFVWTLTPGAYTAKAHYVCAADGDAKDYDAAVSKVSTTNPTCGADGKNVWKASYEGHEETKDEALPATGNHTYVREAHATVDKVFTHTCSECNKVIFEAHLNDSDIYYYDFRAISDPTMEEDGKFYLTFYNYNDEQHSFSPRSETEEDAPRSTECIIPNFKENGNIYVIDAEHSTITLHSYISLMILANREPTGLGLIGLQPIMRTYYAEETVTFPFDVENDAPEVKYLVQIMTPVAYSGHSVTTPLVSFKAARKDGFDLPIKEEIPEREGYELIGYSATSGGAKQYDFGQHIDIPLNQIGALNFYCVWAA